jgi:NAD(P)-dependent dehydrogenase (short-subunit alcohol dehydrogenase family)
MRVVVVGASSGLGRCVGVALAQRGANVALLARRREPLVDAAKEAGPGTMAVICDVTDEQSVKVAITEAAGGLGGIDGVVYSAGIGPLARMPDINAKKWREVFATNVIGASVVTAAALPHLEESSGSAIYFSSISASQTPPWPGLGSYAVSKAALDKMVEAWRAEYPHVGFTRLVIGDCGGGEGDAVSHFANGWDGELAGQFMPQWFAKGYLTGTLMPVERLVNAVDFVLQAGAADSIPSLVVAPRPPAPAK